jgi:uncharacterized protein
MRQEGRGGCGSGETQAAKRVVLDEVHRLRNPSQLLKIAADHYPSVGIIATGSSTLGATRKFCDSLTDRKAELWLTPVMSRDLRDFKNTDLSKRLYSGGLPPFLLASSPPESEFQSWLDDYWAKDIQELFVSNAVSHFCISSRCCSAQVAAYSRRPAMQTPAR